MITKANLFKNQVADYCARIGADSMLVQGAGGNMSWKDADTLWVKASGTWLADAKIKNIFVPVNLSGLQKAIAGGNFPAAFQGWNQSSLRPSIETLLHALMPHKVVLHLHAIGPLAHLVRADSKAEIGQKLLKHAAWAMVRYQKPGDALAMAVANALTENPGIKVLLLENHGIVIGGADIEEIDDQLKQLNIILDAAPISPAFSAQNPSPIVITDTQRYIPVDIPGIHGLACCPDLFGRLKRDWALYPDHIVFLGPVPACYDAAPLLIEDIKTGDAPELIFLKGQGVFSKPDFSAAKQAQLKCYYDVLVRQPTDALLRVLDNQQITDLLDWDAERYRRGMAKQ